MPIIQQTRPSCSMFAKRTLRLPNPDLGCHHFNLDQHPGLGLLLPISVRPKVSLALTIFHSTDVSSIQNKSQSITMTGGAHSGGPHHGYPTGGSLPTPKHYSTSPLNAVSNE